MKSKVLLYLHGFLSSPSSYKAELTRSWLLKNRPDISYFCPFLSSYPSEAIQTIRQLMTSFRQNNVEPMVIGSSLGGYWGTWISQEYAARAAIINPAVSPSIFKPEFLGVELKSYYSDDVYVLSERDVTDLRSVFVESIGDKNKIWLLAQKGDKTCDYRLSKEKYRGCKQLIEEGGDHSFQGYDRWLPEIIDFLEKPS